MRRPYGYPPSAISKHVLAAEAPVNVGSEG
jgi:hypothetical protein